MVEREAKEEAVKKKTAIKFPIIHKVQDVLIRRATNGFIVTSFRDRDDGSFTKDETLLPVDDEIEDCDRAELEAFVRAMYEIMDIYSGFGHWRIKVDIYNKYEK